MKTKDLIDLLDDVAQTIGLKSPHYATLSTTVAKLEAAEQLANALANQAAATPLSEEVTRKLRNFRNA